MKYLAAYLLLKLSEKESISAEDVKGLLAGVGAEGEIEDDKIAKLLEKVEGKDLDELIAEGEKKLLALGGSGGGGGGSGGAAAGGGDAAAAEEKVEEKEEEAVDVGGGALFGDEEGY